MGVDLKTFATKDNPMRCSSIDSFVKCGLRAIYTMNVEEPLDSDMGAAHNGSMLHKLVSRFHKFVASHKIDDYLQLAERIYSADKESLKLEFPQGSVEDVRVAFYRYCVDPRNNQATLVLNEEPVEYILPPAEFDTTKEMIYVKGTLDQVRLNMADQSLEVWDVKFSSRQTKDIMYGYMFQLYAYYLGVLFKFQDNPKMLESVKLGGFILPKRYDTRKNSNDLAPPEVFAAVPYRSQDITAIVMMIQKTVADIRTGRVGPSPGLHCYGCRSRGPSFCIPEYANGMIQLGGIK